MFSGGAMIKKIDTNTKIANLSSVKMITMNAFVTKTTFRTFIAKMTTMKNR